MRPRRLIVAAVCLTGAATATVLIVRDADVSRATPAATTAPTAPPAGDRKTVAVEQRDLTRTETLGGTVGHGDKRPLALAGGGTITRLPAAGDVVQFGAPIAEVDGEPVLLLQGDRPQWRTLGPGVKGVDVQQLETALVAMGYADASTLVVDEKWTNETTVAVKKLQRWNGLPEDGRLDMGEVVFAPTVVRIAEVGGSLGASASSAGLQVTGLDQSVRAVVKASKLDLVHVGDSVQVELPDGSTMAGTVQRIEAAIVAEDGSVTFPVVVSTSAVDVEDGSSVKVQVEVVLAAQATVVPADALLALAEGGYAVEVPDATTPTGSRLVAVEVGAFADGDVAVTGDLAAGAMVVVP